MSHPPPVAADAFLIPTRRGFLECLDLARPVLAPVKAALERDDLQAAGRAYLNHLSTRPLGMPLLTDWSRQPRIPDRDHKIADDCLRGRLWDGYNVYDIPPAGIDWHDCPLFCLPRFPVFPPLLEAFHDTGDARYLRFIVDHSLQFIRAYPIEDYAGKHSNEGMRNHYLVGPPTWWCLLPNRLEMWAAAIEVLRRSKVASDEEMLIILHRALQETRWFLTQVPYWLSLMHNAAGFYVRVIGILCWLFDDFAEARQWRVKDAEWLATYIEGAFYPDGLFKELTTGYSTSVSEQVSLIALVLKDEPAIAARRARVAGILTAMTALAGPTRRVPSLGDCYAQMVGDFLHPPVVRWLDDAWLTWALATLHEPGGHELWRQRSAGHGQPFGREPATEAHEASRDAAATAGAHTSKSAEVALTPTLSRDQRAQENLLWPAKTGDAWGGYYAMRSDWSHDARFMLIDGGPWGTAHQHMDKLSFVLSAYGADFLVDPCCSLYANNEPDARLSTLHAGFLHNSITVDGLDEYVQRYPNAKPDAKDSLHHSAYWQTDRALDNRWEHGPGYSLFVGRFDFAPRKAVRWERRVVFVHGAYWWLQDVITGDPSNAAIEQNFQFEEGTRVALTWNGARADAFNGASLSVIDLDSTLKPTMVIGEETPRTTYSTQYETCQGPRQMEHGRGWVARFNKRIIPAPALTWSGEAKLPCVLTRLLVPTPAGAGSWNEGSVGIWMPRISQTQNGDATRWNLLNSSGHLAIDASLNGIKVGRVEPISL